MISGWIKRLVSLIFEANLDVNSDEPERMAQSNREILEFAKEQGWVYWANGTKIDYPDDMKSASEK